RNAAGASQAMRRSRTRPTRPSAIASGTISDHSRIEVRWSPRMRSPPCRRFVCWRRYDGESAFRRLKTFEMPCAERHAYHGTRVAEELRRREQHEQGGQEDREADAAPEQPRGGPDEADHQEGELAVHGPHVDRAHEAHVEVQEDRPPQRVVGADEPEALAVVAE